MIWDGSATNVTVGSALRDYPKGCYYNKGDGKLYFNPEGVTDSNDSQRVSICKVTDDNEAVQVCHHSSFVDFNPGGVTGSTDRERLSICKVVQVCHHYLRLNKRQ